MNPEKQVILSGLLERVNASPYVIVIDYTGLKVKQFSELRNRLFDAGASCTVAKNSYMRKVLTEAGLPDIGAELTGQTAFVTGSSEVFAAAKTIKNFEKEFKMPQMKVGILGDAVLDSDKLKAIAERIEGNGGIRPHILEADVDDELSMAALAAQTRVLITTVGPYVKHGTVYANIPDVEEVFTIGMNRAMEVLAQKAARGGRGSSAPAGPLKVLGAHPDGGEVQVMPGRSGPYVKWEKVNATLPKEMPPEEVTLEQALELIAEKAAKGGKKTTARKAPAKAKAPAKKAAAKPAAKKAPTKKAAKTA